MEDDFGNGAKGRDSFEEMCGTVDEKSYDFKKAIRIPGRMELEAEANKTNIDTDLKTKLEKGVSGLSFHFSPIPSPVTFKFFL